MRKFSTRVKKGEKVGCRSEEGGAAGWVGGGGVREGSLGRAEGRREGEGEYWVRGGRDIKA